MKQPYQQNEVEKKEQPEKLNISKIDQWYLNGKGKLVSLGVWIVSTVVLGLILWNMILERAAMSTQEDAALLDAIAASSNLPILFGLILMSVIILTIMCREVVSLLFNSMDQKEKKLVEKIQAWEAYQE